MKIGALARSLGVPVPTLRRWTQEFAEGLSPEAQGGDGRPREFTVRDQRVLRRVQEILAADDVTYAQARRRLREEGLLTPPPRQEEPPETGPATEEEREAAQRFVSVVVEQITQPLVDRLEALEREIASLQQKLADLQVPTTVEPTDTTNASRRRWPFG